MNPNNTNLIFLDLETSGLNASNGDRILELAVLPVSADLEVLHTGWSTVIHPGDYPLSRMNAKVTEMHTGNGLLKELATENLPGLATVERIAIGYCEQFVVRGQTPLAGSTIHFDRKFLERYMPGLSGWFHYRNADVSSVKEFFRRWFPNVPEPPKIKAHRALGDCYGSLAEARFYKEMIQLRDPNSGEEGVTAA